jgi:hypothetical protein
VLSCKTLSLLRKAQLQAPSLSSGTSKQAVKEPLVYGVRQPSSNIYLPY